MKTLCLIGIAMAAVVGCASPHDDVAASSAAVGSTGATGGAQGVPASLVQTSESVPSNAVMPHKIIYTGEVSLVCENLDKASDGLDERVKEFGAYIGDANRTGTKGQNRQATWTIRVPATRFDGFLKSLNDLGELQSSSRKADDVSEEYYDAESHLKNKRIEETRLIDLLQRASGKLADVLTLEKELTRVRGEIEMIEGRLRFLANQTTYSTVTVTIQEVKDFIPATAPTLSTKVGRSFGGSVEALADTGTTLLLLLVAIIPWILPIAGACWIIWRVLKSQHLKALPPAPPTDTAA